MIRQNSGNAIVICQKVNGCREVCFTPDGKTLAASGRNNTIRFWDVATGKQIRTVKVPGWWLTTDLAQDGKIAACGSDNAFGRKIYLWDLASGKQLGKCWEPGDRGFWCFGPDSESLILGQYDERRHDILMYLWNWKTGKRIREFEGRPICVTATAVSPQRQTLAVADGESIRLWNVGTGKELSFPDNHRTLIHCVAVSLDGRTAITGSEDHTIRLWEVPSGKPLRVWDGRQGQVASVAFSPDGKRVASGGSETVRIWDVQSGKDLATSTGNAEDWFLKLAFSPDGKMLVGGSWGGRVYRWDIKSGKEHRRLDLHGNARGDPRALFLGVRNLACISNDGANVYDLDTGALVPPFSETEVGFLENPLHASAFSPDGHLLATANRSKEIYLRETIHNRVIDCVYSTVQGPDDPLSPPQQRAIMSAIFSLAFSPDSRIVVAGYENGKVVFWDLPRGESLHIFHGPISRITTMAFTPDGKYLISGNQDGTALVWKVPDSIRHPQREEKTLKDAELRAFDCDLKDGDSRKAFSAIESLISAPAQSVPFLRRQLPPIPPIDGKKIPRLIEALDSDRFSVREAAMRDLATLGIRAAAPLRSTLASKPSLEVRRRIEGLLQTIKLETLYASRAILVLERIGTPEARQVLQDLSKGDPAAWQTQIARAALERLARR